MDEMAELATVDETFVQITRSMNFYVGELKSAGFNEVRQEPLPAASTDAWAAAMWHMEMAPSLSQPSVSGTIVLLEISPWFSAKLLRRSSQNIVSWRFRFGQVRSNSWRERHR